MSSLFKQSNTLQDTAVILDCSWRKAVWLTLLGSDMLTNINRLILWWYLKKEKKKKKDLSGFYFPILNPFMS